MSSVNSFGADNLRIALDRFHVTCPADPSCIQQFDPKLPIPVDGTLNREVTTTSGTASGSTGIWAAVYRSNQNQPSVLVRDEFFHAMRDATSGPALTESSGALGNTWAEKLQTPMAQQIPVAVAQLRPSSDFKNTWILDSLRCALKKEDMDETCDGGSEFLEALSVGIDSLLLYHLKQLQQQQQQPSTLVFEGSIRTKATLFSHRLLEDRGFLPVETLSKDMATHVSNLDTCLQKYAQRSVDTRLNPGARDRALQIVAWLGRMDRPVTTMMDKDVNSENNKDIDDNDPWANIKMRI